METGNGSVSTPLSEPTWTWGMGVFTGLNLLANTKTQPRSIKKLPCTQPVLLICKIEFTSKPISAAISLPSKVKKQVTGKLTE
jgi:hypothetical protein